MQQNHLILLNRTVADCTWRKDAWPAEGFKSRQCKRAQNYEEEAHLFRKGSEEGSRHQRDRTYKNIISDLALNWISESL